MVYVYFTVLHGDYHLQVIILTILFFSITILPTTPLEFDFPTFSTFNPNISYEQSAHADGDVIQLAPQDQDLNIGRVTYAQPLHLWDRASGNLTDFTTNFTFLIDSHKISRYGRYDFYNDGIAFFLAPNGSRIPENATGWSFGLMNSYSTPQFVAIEFDTYVNRPDYEDPGAIHVGIDVNSVTSVNATKWWARYNILNGRKNEASISYNAQSGKLSVVFTGWRHGLPFTDELHAVVDLRQHLPEFVTVGFSGATSNASASQTIYSWSFESSPGGVPIPGGVPTPGGVSIPTVAPSTTPETNITAFHSTKVKEKTRILIGSAVGGPTFLVVLGLLICYIQKNKKAMSREVEEPFKFDLNAPNKFAYKDLKKATNNFAEQNKLGEGGFGSVYKGFLKGINSFIAVKRVSSDSNQGLKEYAAEVKIISTLRHRNMVQLLGWCNEDKELLIVYEFMPNGSLDYHLFQGKSRLNWSIRFKIAQRLASALLYLHEECEQCILHRDIKSSNVMLDADFNPKLGDFGLARLVDHEKGSMTTALAGTMGYMAPECVVTGKASKETDVFSFGIVALEIACGRKPIDQKVVEENHVNLVEWVWSLYGEQKLLDAGDSKLNAEFNSRQMEQLMIVGLWCAHPDSNSRPSIRQAVLLLNFEAPLPLLPLRMPEPNYMSQTI